MMAAKLQPYPKYNAVAYDYVNSLPDGWKLLPNIAIFEERKEKGTLDEQLLSISSYKGIIKSSDYEDRKDRSSEDKSEYLLVHEGDLAYNTMLMWSGAVGYSKYRGIVSPSYTVLKPKIELNSKYFHYFFRTELYRNYSKRFSYGIVDSRLRLYYTHFKRMYSIVPPLSIQNAIVDYLDEKCEEIDRFIKNKERLIELVEEQQADVISDVITHGINEAEFKETKLNWLSSIPKNWNLIPLGYLLSYISYGFTNPMSTTDAGPYMLTANDIGDGEILFETARRTSESDFKRFLTEKSIPKNGDILLTKDGTLGRTSLFYGGKTCINQSVAILRVNPKKAVNTFIEQALRSKVYQDKMIYDAEGTTIKHIYITKLVKMKIALPPVDLQKEIVENIVAVRNKNKETINKIQNEIAAIKEFKEGLITSMITGKLSPFATN